MNVGVATNGPVFAAQQFAVHRKFVDQPVGETHVVAHLRSDVEAGPIGFAGEMDHHRGVAFRYNVEVPYGHVTRCHGTNMHRWRVG